MLLDYKSRTKSTTSRNISGGHGKQKYRPGDTAFFVYRTSFRARYERPSVQLVGPDNDPALKLEMPLFTWGEMQRHGQSYLQWLENWGALKRGIA